MRALNESRFSTGFSHANWICCLLTLALLLSPRPSLAEENPALVGQWPGYARGGALGVFVTNNLAFIATDYGGLIIMDVSDAANPVRVGDCDTSGSAWGVTVAGNHAYVVGYEMGLLVIDVSNPANPVRVGGCDTSGESFGVAVAGEFAYLADREGGLAIFQLAGAGRRVTPLGWSHNTLRVSVPTTSGKAYALEYKDLLGESEWTRLPAVPGTNGQLILTDPAAAGPQRFYRVREE